MSNDSFDIIGEDLFMPALNYNFALHVRQWHVYVTLADQNPHRYWKLWNVKFKKCSDVTDNNLIDPASTRGRSVWCDDLWLAEMVQHNKPQHVI